ncbi:hypothetical protein NDA14_003937 [Ustilago hordei]|nr:hypothetical protein NDA10_000734 [Ustilago hordei]KAJ1592424.1 hypothetical protein NDA15_002082 [Ustilago hordei]KAJ1595818.1 hypothetical protein NDA14_003937 [Ustilago hordei]UTT89824.1 hypothetical protein NDA17_004592 [Ustilago hordei]
MTPRSGVSVDDDEVDGVGDEIGDVNDNEVDGVGDKVGGVNTSVQCVDLMLEVIPGPQWTTAFGSIYIRTANLLWGAYGHQVVVIQHTHYDEEQP